MVNFELYRIFVIVANELNITKASEKLHISQPAVSKHIKNLENELKTKLFTRSNHGIELTEDGKKIFDEAKEHVYALENISENYTSSYSLSMGIHATMLNKLFSVKLAKFYETNENVKINIVNNDIEEMLSKLSKQNLDIVISKKSFSKLPNNIEFIKLGTMQDILICNESSEFIDKQMSLTNLQKQIIYMPRKTSITTLNFFSSLNLKEKDFANIKNISYSTMLEIIKNNTGIGVVTKEYVQKELNEKEIFEVKTTFTLKPIQYGIYINKNNKTKELLNLIKELKRNQI